MILHCNGALAIPCHWRIGWKEVKDDGYIERAVVVDEKGRCVGVLLDLAAYKRLPEEAAELESIRAYDVATASADEVIPFEQAVEEIKPYS